ncbi:AAA family ATPase [Isachenkonia alkalipeptolytica]|uniref:AAA family ATPase n=1 Tax=Isachenkonia alkalipeptolytica TaxID=2565777 RepID=A0AA44BD73_9CLOT|nr:AAA family ATPase [Isachenkonia alkalipeptolytica]NBG88034.1 AAA family ATPase [Isachenkonia alkalipeptolytica]
MSVEIIKEFREKMVENVSKVIIGKEEVIELLTVAFICDGHVLLEDAPGLGKTKLVRSFAKTIGSKFKRIQFTPDLLPSDLTGIHFYNQKTMEFEFRPGPMFANVILADEINRATPRTQSSLLEAMEEHQITVDGATRQLENPYMVLATQNPIETHGTFPLPEAQLDRFFMRISMGYPSREDELAIVDKNLEADPLKVLEEKVVSGEIEALREAYKEVSVSQDVRSYLMDIIEKTREDQRLLYGVSPRGTIALYKGAQAYAAIQGRDFMIPEDVKTMAKYILNHRIGYKGSFKNRHLYDGIEKILMDIDTPTESKVG